MKLAPPGTPPTPAISPAFLIALAVSGVLGALGGGASWLLPPAQAWNSFVAAFLWTLIAAAGTTIGRCTGEKLRRGRWVRGLWIAFAQSLPLTTLFLLVAALAGPGLGIIPAVAPTLYASTLALALVLGALCVMSSPYH